MASDHFPTWVPNINGQVWDYLARILRGLPHGKTAGVLALLTINIELQEPYQNPSAPTRLAKVLPEIARVEKLLVDLVAGKASRRVKIELKRGTATGTVLSGDLVPELFPVLHEIGVLSF